MQFGVYTFVETERDPATGRPIHVERTLAETMAEIELADRVGLDVFALGEHHRPDYAVSAPAVALAYAAARTKTIRLSSAVTVLSSDDPVRVYQQYATLDLLSGGRAEIMAGRGSFIESFPLFGYDLDDYDELFAEKLELLLAIRANERVTWEGRLRAPLKGLGVYPRALQDPCPSGSRSAARRNRSRAPELSACRSRWRSSAASRRVSRRSPISIARPPSAPARIPASLALGINGHGFLADTAEAATAAFYEPYAETMARHRPRARLAAADARPVRSRPRAERPPDGRNAGRGDRQDPRPARALRPPALSDADARRADAARGGDALDRAVRDGGRAGGAPGAG